MIKPLGISENQLTKIQGILNSILKNKLTWKVSVFGSRAKGNYKKYSDLDLWLETTPEITPTELSTLSEAFEESDLPIKVDLVIPTTVIAEYRSSILKDKKIWLES